jgi:hypothetical protein
MREIKLFFGECDCCEAKQVLLHHTEVAGLETFACTECVHADPEDDADTIETEIANLAPGAESGEQWAHLCLLFQALENLKPMQARWEETNGQFGVGA